MLGILCYILEDRSDSQISATIRRCVSRYRNKTVKGHTRAFCQRDSGPQCVIEFSLSLSRRTPSLLFPRPVSLSPPPFLFVFVESGPRCCHFALPGSRISSTRRFAVRLLAFYSCSRRSIRLLTNCFFSLKCASFNTRPRQTKRFRKRHEI